MVRITLAAAVSICFLGVIWIWGGYSDLNKSISAMREAYFSSKKQTLTYEVQKAIDYIEYEKARTEDRLRNELRNRVDDAYAIAAHLLETYQSRMPRDVIEDLIRDSLRPIRFLNGRGYYFATNLNGVEELFADRPEMEGRNMLDIQGGRGEYVVRDMIELVLWSGDGFYRYYWTKPDLPGNQHLKMAYVKLLKPLNWIIGTGEYLDDFRDDIQQEVLERLSRIRFDGDGYIFAARYDGLSLLGQLRGRNMLENPDSKAAAVTRELISKAKNGGGFVSYLLPRKAGNGRSPKISYVQGIDEWNWFVGAGIRTDEIDAVIEQKTRDFKMAAVQRFLEIMAILALLVLASLFWAWRTARLSKSDYLRFEGFFQQAPHEPVMIDPEILNFSEFRELALHGNRMLGELEKTKSHLMEERERFKVLTDESPLGVSIIQSDGVYKYVNPKFIQMFGYTLSDIPNGREWFRLAFPDEKLRTRVIEKWKKDLLNTSTGEPRWSNYPVTCKGGEIRMITFFPVMLSTKEQLVVYQDNTESIRSEEALKESEELYRTLFEAVNDAIFLMQGDRIVECNPRTLSMYGCRNEDIIGKTPVDFSPEFQPNGDSSVEKNVEVIDLALNGRQLFFQWRSRRLDGTFFDAEVNLSRILLKSEPYLLAMVRDVTERVESERALRNLEQQLRHSQKMEAIGTMASGISHDFNNILAAILGYGEAALELALDGKTNTEQLRRIIQAAERGRDTVRRILSFSRKARFGTDPICLNDLITNLVSIIEKTFPKNIRVEISLADDLAAVEADADQLEQVIMNLANNARDAMPDGGRLFIETGHVFLDEEYCRSHFDVKPGDYVQVEISDAGVGMDERTLEQIFDPFFTTKEIGKGTGLGLSTALGVINSYGGHIYCYSEPGMGTSVKVLLPASARSASEEAPRQRALVDVKGGNENILLVDDEPALREVGVLVLESAGYKVLTARNGEEALDIYSQQMELVELVILDLGMPGMGGRKCLDELLRLNPKSRVVIASGYSSDSRISEVLEAGAERICPQAF